MDEYRRSDAAETIARFEQEVERLQAAADAGDPQAACRLFRLLADSEQLDRLDDPVALLRAAADADLTEAQLLAGELYVESFFEEPPYAAGFCMDELEPDEVVDWLEQALPRDSAAAVTLVQIFHRGLGVPPSEEAVVEYCAQAAEQTYEGDAAAGQAFCMGELARRCAEGVGTAQDRDEAARLYRMLDSSDDEFMFRYYSDGEDVPRAPRAAVQWWLRDELWQLVHLRRTEYMEPNPGGEERADHLRWLTRDTGNDWMERFGKRELYRWLEDGMPAWMRDDLNDVIDGERVRLVYDAAQNGDARCAGILRTLTGQGVEGTDRLEELQPDAHGIFDWPQAWYEQALERIEQHRARKSEELRYYREMAAMEDETLAALFAEHATAETDELAPGDLLGGYSEFDGFAGFAGPEDFGGFGSFGGLD